MDFEALAREAELIFAVDPTNPGRSASRDRLQRLCELVAGRVPWYDWFGFYVAERRKPELILGPFVGEPTEHTRIPFGRGICGQAAERKNVFVVDDVGAAANYLACSLKVKSEIVVPVFGPGTEDVAGEIDIDSHTAAAFSDADRAFLERLAELVAADVEAIRE